MAIEVRGGSVWIKERRTKLGKWRYVLLPNFEKFPMVFHNVLEGEGEVRVGARDEKAMRRLLRDWWKFLTVLKHTPALRELRERLVDRRITGRMWREGAGFWLILRNEGKKRAIAAKGLEEFEYDE